MGTNGDLLFREECYRLVGAAFEVYNELGPDFFEPIYQEAYEVELKRNDIAFVAQPELKIYYKGNALSKAYYADLIAHGEILIELKALERLGKREEAQVLNYLKASNLKLGIIINFGHPEKLEWKRIVR